jgi:hypothetical protein
MTSRVAALLLALLLGGCGWLSDKPPAVSPKVPAATPVRGTLADDADFVAIRRQLIGRSLPVLGLADCRQSVRYERVHVRELSPAAVTSLGREGILRPVAERVRLACTAPPFNFMLARRANGAPVVRATLPGATETDPVVQADAIKAAVDAAIRQGEGVPPDCRGGIVRNSFLTTPRTPRADGGSRWSELWTVETCGALTDVPIRFEGNPKTGTRFAIEKG